MRALVRPTGMVLTSQPNKEHPQREKLLTPGVPGSPHQRLCALVPVLSTIGAEAALVLTDCAARWASLLL